MNSQQAQPAIGFQEGVISEQGWMEAHASALSVTENESAGIDTAAYCYSRPFSNKHTLKPPEPERPVKVPKMMKPRSAASQTNGEEGARSDPPADWEFLRPNLKSVDACFDLDASCEDAFTDQLTRVHYMPDLSLFSLIDEQISTSAHTPVNGNASIDLGVLHAQSSTKDQWAADQLDEKYLELLDPYMLSQHPSDCCPQDSAPIQPLSTKLDVSSSSTNPLQTSPLLTEEMQPLSIQAARHPPTQYEVVRNYWSGEMLSNSYLDRIRGAVDPAFSNDNWGDEYYFTDSVGFKGLKDIKPNSDHKIDDVATLEGLQLRATAIPHRTVEESWNSYYATVDRVANGDRKGKVQFSSFEGAWQGTRQPTMLMDGQSLHGGLQHGIQAQKGTRCRNLMQGIRPAMPVAPSIHSVQFGTAPFIPRSIDSSGNNGLVGDGIFDHNAQL
ncbi:hypothetical protein EPUS_04924 [Endocarpon pusillum Z07020]|uniref:Uncharacterized protein n=1 Tax=Endocarpon pusillum (strain Z07020 / HMAS-L-300199) TaxID=1263415 RepID=U1HVM5_ENDPU|nr:uncharacterized protein EPUS_04924 [Endocarpon pusillum Z07020]ERF74755.1 hypothetical protein EPUS_04924 [Endocarpon pusillum Z07020]